MIVLLQDEGELFVWIIYKIWATIEAATYPQKCLLGTCWCRSDIELSHLKPSNYPHKEVCALSLSWVTSLENKNVIR